MRLQFKQCYFHGPGAVASSGVCPVGQSHHLTSNSFFSRHFSCVGLSVLRDISDTCSQRLSPWPPQPLSESLVQSSFLPMMNPQTEPHSPSLETMPQGMWHLAQKGKTSCPPYTATCLSFLEAKVPCCFGYETPKSCGCLRLNQRQKLDYTRQTFQKMSHVKTL